MIVKVIVLLSTQIIKTLHSLILSLCKQDYTFFDLELDIALRQLNEGEPCRDWNGLNGCYLPSVHKGTDSVEALFTVHERNVLCSWLVKTKSDF